MQQKISFSSYLFIGVMLFALFFGAGNLIFPASLGQHAGQALWPAIMGFLVTGVGLPFLGIVAMGFSGSENLQMLASRVHPIYGIIFTSVLYLTIGPFFAAPRTGAVAYDIGFSSFVPSEYGKLALFLFTLIFFAVSYWLSLNPSKIVDRIGKIMSPAIIILLLILLIVAFINPLGALEPAHADYKTIPFFKGFLEGYNTMDVLSSLVFGIIVINSIRALGVTDKVQIMKATAKTGVVAAGFLAIIYIGIAYLGASSTGSFGLFDTGGPVLSQASSYYFGTFGTVLLAIIILLACLTTSIGLITACGEYFNSVFPRISYKAYVTIFSLFCFVVSNFGLDNIITYSIPVLLFLYPLAVVLMLLTFLSPLFHHSRIVYVSATIVAFLISIVDGIASLYKSLENVQPAWLEGIIEFLEKALPLYSYGLGWVLPVVVVILITSLLVRIFKSA
ncbi:branched-chain amino acid transport system II carrier protein [Sporosarcina sp. Te-1]|uniref:branched-chain amino acid transport system II carrier protein n=1 Tax=Sporosarcina sp. Te-1 TaxID=2818390 RepID=UPI001A9E72B3|nr:branched-chain amino acid transport system II carrier protein [Sporosarcina sp. Te-1]QTD41358.1 branched-chain amino acid transport system II carrier protein [Sporosarcina sp. Te-1]